MTSSSLARSPDPSVRPGKPAAARAAFTLGHVPSRLQLGTGVGDRFGLGRGLRREPQLPFRKAELADHHASSPDLLGPALGPEVFPRPADLASRLQTRRRPQPARQRRRQQPDGQCPQRSLLHGFISSDRRAWEGFSAFGRPARRRAWRHCVAPRTPRAAPARSRLPGHRPSWACPARAGRSRTSTGRRRARVRLPEGLCSSRQPAPSYCGSQSARRCVSLVR